MIKVSFKTRLKKPYYGFGFGFDFSYSKPDMDCTQWSEGEEVPILDRQFRLALCFFVLLLEIKTHRNIYEIECIKRGIKP